MSDLLGRVSTMRRSVVGAALCCAVLTSPFLETLAADQTNDEAVASAEAPTAPAPAPVPAPVTTQPSTPAIVGRTPTIALPAAPAPAPTPAANIVSATAAQPTVALDPQWRSKISPDYLVEDAGCAKDLSAAGLAAFLAQPLGSIKGFDEPRAYPLGDGRTLWALQDAFVDETGRATSFAHMGYANSMMLIQDGSCFTSLRRGTTSKTLAFELGTGAIDFNHYFWPAGGVANGGTLQMFWMEMARDPKIADPLDGIALHPASTWLATYDIATMQRLSFVPAPNSGVLPVYGYTVVQSGSWDYLFGNTYLQNFVLEGGHANGPHTATKMFLARVPAGHLEASATYWNGTDWSSDAGTAAPISSRSWTENLMLPVMIGDQWVSATKIDGFQGSTVSIDTAPEPWGPWTTVKTIPAIPRGDPTDMVTYHALVLPYLDPSGALIVSLSQITLHLGDVDAPPKYRPNVFTVAI